MTGVDRDGGGIDMFPDLTTGVVTAIGAAGSNLETGWQGKLGEIATLDSQLGNGPLGIAIAEQYNPAVDEIVAGMTQTKDSVTRSVDIGQQCVGLYVDADAQSRQNFGG